jgi:hypothetical protein
MKKIFFIMSLVFLLVCAGTHSFAQETQQESESTPGYISATIPVVSEEKLLLKEEPIDANNEASIEQEIVFDDIPGDQKKGISRFFDHIQILWSKFLSLLRTTN